jgi:hypothetical protein
MTQATPSAAQIADALRQRVIGQEEAVREISIALAKKLANLSTGNVLLIGSSGTGKTTVMRAVEDYLASNPVLADRSTLVRVHANILAEHSAGGRAGGALLRRILDRAREQLGPEAPIDRLMERVGTAMIFVDEIDKIRAAVGDQPNVSGIRAQEALLTLIENESVPFVLPEWAGGGNVVVDASGLLFIGAGAFEGLYDSVYDRVTIGRDRGALQAVSVMEGGEVRQELRFSLREWLRHEDLFDYGMSPQYRGRAGQDLSRQPGIGFPAGRGLLRGTQYPAGHVAGSGAQSRRGGRRSTPPRRQGPQGGLPPGDPRLRVRAGKGGRRRHPDDRPAGGRVGSQLVGTVLLVASALPRLPERHQEGQQQNQEQSHKQVANHRLAIGGGDGEKCVPKVGVEQ